MQVKDLQNIFDLSLNTYGSLNQVVKLAGDNNLDLDAAPPVGLSLIFDPDQGQRQVQQFYQEEEFFYNNNVVEATAAILANENTALSPKIEVIFIYK